MQYREGIEPIQTAIRLAGERNEEPDEGWYQLLNVFYFELEDYPNVIRTLTTLVLLFAVLRVRPTPFVVLDEVDAPLDEANVRRFLVLLNEFTAKTQFLMITHNKLTMVRSDSLVGVTMEEKGVSKKIALNIAEINEDPNGADMKAAG